MLAPVVTVPEEDSRTQQTAVYKRAASNAHSCAL
jgi:hypothetical protein